MKKLLICNQKMFLTHDEAEELESKMSKLNYDNVSLIICPSYLNLPIFKDYELGAQDCFYEDKGPFTGQVSAYHLACTGVKYVLVGHSEKRDADTNEVINKKVKAVLRNSLTPVLCVGETKLERELRKTSEVIKKQLEIGLKGVALDSTQEIFVAYEPRWLIGSNKSLALRDVEDVLTYVKKILLGLGITKFKLLYGGAVTADNVTSLLSNDIEGYLIGNSSVSFPDLNEIIKCIK